jgi:large subunit ribosomal protein L22e
MIRYDILQETFLRERIKVKGKAGKLGDAVKIRRDKSKVYVTAQPPFSKRYLKYLTKKFLKKQRLRDWLRVVAKDKATYELRYFNIHEAEEALAEGEREQREKREETNHTLPCTLNIPTILNTLFSFSFTQTHSFFIHLLICLFLFLFFRRRRGNH